VILELFMYETVFKQFPIPGCKVHYSLISDSVRKTLYHSQTDNFVLVKCLVYFLI
jgi:hypothetical protein